MARVVVTPPATHRTTSSSFGIGLVTLGFIGLAIGSPFIGIAWLTTVIIIAACIAAIAFLAASLSSFSSRSTLTPAPIPAAGVVVTDALDQPVYPNAYAPAYAATVYQKASLFGVSAPIPAARARVERPGSFYGGSSAMATTAAAAPIPAAHVRVERPGSFAGTAYSSFPPPAAVASPSHGQTAVHTANGTHHGRF